MENPEHQQQTVILTSPNSVSLTLGIIGVVVGTFALMACWVPVLGLAVIPSSIVGALLSLSGIVFACLKKYRSIELPVLGVLLCSIAISVSIYSSMAAAAAVAKTIRDAQLATAAENARKQAQQIEWAKEQQAEIAREKAAQVQQMKDELSKFKSELPDDQLALQIAQTNYDAVKMVFDAYQLSPPYKTNTVYLNLVGEISTLKYAVNAFSAGANSSAINQSAYVNEHAQYGATTAALRAQAATGQQDNYNKARQSKAGLAAAEQQLENLISQSDAWQQNRMDKATGQLNAAQSKLDSATANVSTLTAQLSQ